MSRPYLTIEDKFIQPHYALWSHEASEKIKSTLMKKGYFIIVPTTRKGYDNKEHNSWVVYRKEIGVILEQLFRQRVNVEVEATGTFEADIIFVSDPHETDMLKIVKRFQKIKEVAP
ncbi:MAG: hypothetical protein IJF83_05800 [Methanobrevibacter sp.]|nr:hypothetical protein [Methanobrevibacter sp.]